MKKLEQDAAAVISEMIRIMEQSTAHCREIREQFSDLMRFGIWIAQLREELIEMLHTLGTARAQDEFYPVEISYIVQYHPEKLRAAARNTSFVKTADALWRKIPDTSDYSPDAGYAVAAEQLIWSSLRDLLEEEISAMPAISLFFNELCHMAEITRNMVLELLDDRGAEELYLLHFIRQARQNDPETCQHIADKLLAELGQEYGEPLFHPDVPDRDGALASGFSQYLTDEKRQQAGEYQRLARQFVPEAPDYDEWKAQDPDLAVLRQDAALLNQVMREVDITSADSFAAFLLKQQ